MPLECPPSRAKQYSVRLMQVICRASHDCKEVLLLYAGTAGNPSTSQLEMEATSGGDGTFCSRRSSQAPTVRTILNATASVWHMIASSVSSIFAVSPGPYCYPRNTESVWWGACRGAANGLKLVFFVTQDILRYCLPSIVETPTRIAQIATGRRPSSWNGPFKSA